YGRCECCIPRIACAPAPVFVPPLRRHCMTSFSQAAGDALRRARERRGYTMQRVSELTRGRFKPSSIGGWERAEREISLQRFCELSEVYAVSPDRLLAEALESMAPDERGEVVIDLTRLPLLEGEEQGLLRV